MIDSSRTTPTRSVSEKLKDYNDSMMLTVDTLKVDDIATTNVSLRLGNKIYNLIPSQDQEILPEDQIKKELEDKLTIKRNNIRDVIKNKMAEVSAIVSSIQEEYDRKERLLKDTMSKAVPMPEITWEHAKKGLSIVKGRNRGELIWLAKRTYNPKFVDHKNIEPLYVKKLITPIYLKIVTQDDKVLSVTSHYVHSLELFSHYHQTGSGDCWGNWRRPDTWKTIEDILRVADDATAVMENINTMSIAKRSPALLPRLETLRRHVLNTTVAPTEVRVNTNGLREGLGMAQPDADIWGN